ncbi:uncharacterized protein LOC130236466 [Danio aesculapii]|uniref:uncharacterized protein LOC130236466 n=1 Tax=Danio aesculapii TaxID=1142201 RepID=UPI0024C05A76|nr:uncharacterized protein LOC130236466 [Danio aesculapii]
MSAIVNTQQPSLAACISNAHTAQEPTTCCSQTKSSEVSKKHHKTPLRMLSHRWQRLGLQPPGLWETQDDIAEHTESRPALEIHPIKVNSMVSPNSESPDGSKAIIGSVCSSNKHLEGNASAQSVECENSDLSDQEKDSIPLIKWDTPVELYLRPDSFDRDLEPIEAGVREQVYPEVLPFSLKDLELSQLISEAEDLESQQSLCSTDPCVAALAARMIKLEKLQTVTIQKEQGKAVGSRPATSSVKSGNRVKQLQNPGSQAVLEEITKLTLSSNSHLKSMNSNQLSPNSGKVWIGFQQPLALAKKPNSGVVRVKKTEAIVQDDVVHVNKSPKCNSPENSKGYKPTKKAIPKSQKTSSERSSAPAKAPFRKT